MTCCWYNKDVRSYSTLPPHCKSFFDGLIEPQSVFADVDLWVFAEPGREDRAEVGRDPAVSEKTRAEDGRPRAEDGRAEEGRCLEAVLIGSVSELEPSLAFADVGRFKPPTFLGSPDGL